MKIADFIKAEFQGWGKYERIIFPMVILLIIAVSLYVGDSKIALISAVCGISYTILAGKGKISCYFCGLSGTLCYAYLAFVNNLYGNLALYMLYYFPMQVLGIFKWKEHLKQDKQEIVKTRLAVRESFLYLVAALVISVVFGIGLKHTGDMTPFTDAFTTVFSVVGMMLTVRRCIEQWYVWFLVNGMSVSMWLKLWYAGTGCLAMVLMWLTYWVLSIYFLLVWRKELQKIQ